MRGSLVRPNPEARREHRAFVLTWLCALVPALFLVQGCSPGGPGTETGQENEARQMRSLLVRGAAHAGIGEWPEAAALFEQAAEIDPADPAVRYDLALARYRLGELEVTEVELAKIDEGAADEIRARAAYLTAKIALENADVESEAAGYRRALELHPADPAYPYSLARVLPRLDPVDATDEQLDQTDLEVGRLLDDARQGWPGNSRLDSEYAQWALARPEPEIRAAGLELLESLAGEDPTLLGQIAQGRDELEAVPDGPARIPVPLRRALNLLRPTKRFQTDSARFEDRLQLAAIAEPAGDHATGSPARESPTVTLTAADLIPTPMLPEGAEALAIVPFNDAVDPVPGGPREAHLALLGSRGLQILEAGGKTWETLADIEGGSWLAAGELDGDGWMELVVLGAQGARVWGRSAETPWSERSLDPGLADTPFAAGWLVDFEHDGDLDLLASTVDRRLVLVTHRGEAGWGPPTPAPLPTAEALVHTLAAADLDGDDDRDLILAAGSELLLLRNWRQGEFLAWDRWPVPAPVEALLSIDFDSDGDFDLLARAGGEILFWRNLGEGGFAADERDAALGAELAAAMTADALVDTDLDLDGDRDLLVTGRLRSSDLETVAALVNDGQGSFSLSTDFFAGPEGHAGGLLPLDLDGDRDPDLITWGPPGLTGSRASGAEGQTWIVLGLRGLQGKVPLDGRGARIMVADGDRRQWLTTERSEVIVGIGDREPALVQVTWPNGISEYLFAPAADERHPVEQVLRIEGSCPFLYATDDSGEMRFITDILGLAPLGMLGGVDRYIPPDPEEYLRLPDWVTTKNGALELRITEELREVAYLDQVELVAVDAPEAVEVYNGERWIERPIHGLELRLLGRLTPPVSVRDDAGREVLEIVADEDQTYLTNHSVERLYQGATEPHSIEIELPDGSLAGGRPALLLVGWLHWGNTSMNLARDQDPEGAPIFPFLEVPDGAGGWHRTDVEVGLPAGKTKPVVVDLTGVVDPTDPRVRITTDFEVYWDRIAAGRLLDDHEAPHRIQRLAPAGAELTWGGFSRWYRPAANGPYLFDYADRRPWPRRERPGGGERPLSWREHEGFYTEFGDVTDLVAAIDDRQVVLGAGEELALSYAAAELRPPPDGWRRTWFLHNEGWEKDGDPNVACSQTVAPLPTRTMKVYPCSGSPDGSSDSPGWDTPGEDRRTRWVSRDRLERRLLLHLESLGVEKPTWLAAVPDGNAETREESR